MQRRYRLGRPLDGATASLFTSKYLRTWADRFGINLSIASARSQQTNGLAERTIATIEEILRTRIDLRQLTWPSLLSELGFALNNRQIELLDGKSPLFIERGVKPLLPIDLHRFMQRRDRKKAVESNPDRQKEAVQRRIDTMMDMRKNLAEEISKSQANNSKHYDKSKRAVDKALVPGAKVWLRFEGFELDGLKLKGTRAKLRPRFVGPFSVTERISPVSFRIKLPQSKIDTGLHDVFHSRNLIVDRPNAESILPPEKFESALGDIKYVIEDIITHQKHGKQNQFLIKWQDWPETMSSWVSEAALRTDAPETLAEYMAAHDIPSDGQVLDKPAAQPRSKKANSATGKKRKRGPADTKPRSNGAAKAPGPKAKPAKKIRNSQLVDKGPSRPGRKTRSQRNARKSYAHQMIMQSLNRML